MLERHSTKPNSDKMEIIDEQKNGSQQHSISFTAFPNDILLEIKDYLSAKETAHFASVNQRFHSLFQPDIGKREAKDAAACAILPTKENVEKLKALLKACPVLLLHPVKVKNRHEQVIEGTVYQIALHECDDNLIDDEIKDAFKRLKDGEETMEAQRQAQLPEGFLKEEEKICANALTAIDNVFTAFKNASGPNDVTELLQYPYTITINNPAVNEALEACRKAIDALYQSTDKVIKIGRDPSIRLHERVLDRFKENYNVLDDFGSPRNNAIMRSVFGYCQRFAPINFMQAFIQGFYYFLEEKAKLTRSFEYSDWSGHFILPLDSDPHFRLGYEFFGGGAEDGRVGRAWRAWVGCVRYKTFFQSKTAAALQPCYAVTEKALHNNVV